MNHSATCLLSHTWLNSPSHHKKIDDIDLFCFNAWLWLVAILIGQSSHCCFLSFVLNQPFWDNHQPSSPDIAPAVFVAPSQPLRIPTRCRWSSVALPATLCGSSGAQRCSRMLTVNYHGNQWITRWSDKDLCYLCCWWWCWWWWVIVSEPGWQPASLTRISHVC